VHHKNFELPDGSSINVNLPRFKAPEAIFKPSIYKEGSDVKGMHELATESIKECDLDVRSDLYANVILSGGSTLFEGLPKRLEKELAAEAHSAVNIIAPPDRYYSVWTGGSTLSSLQTFGSQWITKDEYEEFGAAIVHKKCV